MLRLTRRALLQASVLASLGLVERLASAGCGQQVVHVEKVVEKEVTKVVKEVVRETVIVEPPPKIIEKTVEKVVTAAPAPKARVTIVADVMAYGWTQFALRRSAAFEEMFPDITMQWRSLSSWNEYPQRIAALQASDSLGDLLEASPGAFPAYWAEKQVVQPLDEVIVADGFDTSGLFRGVRRAFAYQDKQFGLPFIGHAGENVLLYNRKLFEEAGLAYPSADWTLDHLGQSAARLTQHDDSIHRTRQFGFAFRGQLPAAYPLLHLFGAYLLTPNGRQCALESASGIAALRWGQQQIHTHRVAPSPAQVELGPLDMLRRGKLAMLRHSLRALVDLSRAGDSQPAFGGTLFPKHPQTGKVGTLASGMAYCISRKSKAPQEVFRWLKFMASRESGVQMFLDGYADPGCRMASWKDPRILGAYPVCAQIADAAEEAEPERLPWNLRAAESLDTWNREIVALEAGEVSPEECAGRIAKGINRILAKPAE